MQILSGIHFTTQFIDFFVVETKQFVGSFVNVILTRQTCGQLSSRAAESKRRALGNYFSEWICYMFQISKCRGDWDLSLCTTSGLAFGEPMRSGDFRGFNVLGRRKNLILNFTEYSSFKHTSSILLLLHFSFLECFGYLGTFCFFCLPCLSSY